MPMAASSSSLATSAFITPALGATTRRHHHAALGSQQRPPTTSFASAFTTRTVHPRLLPTPTRTHTPETTPPPPHMALNSVVVAGGTGFVGTRLVQHLASRGVAVTVLTRSAGRTPLPQGARAVTWQPELGSEAAAAELQSALRGADAVINLAGHPVVSRWDAAGRERITRSRLASTRALAAALAALPSDERPAALVSASAVGYYGIAQAPGERADESAPPGEDFLARLCVDWETAAAQAAGEGGGGPRVVVTRLGIVLGLGGGALAKMIPAFQAFVGGPLGTGKQCVPWVHIDDLVAILVRAAEDSSMSGVYNAVAPTPVSMAELSAALGRALRRPALLAVPAFPLRLLFGDGAVVLLEGQNVVPKRLLDSGFDFHFKTVDDALKDIVSEM